jgi:hypothetical protein
MLGLGCSWKYGCFKASSAVMRLEGSAQSTHNRNATLGTGQADRQIQSEEGGPKKRRQPTIGEHAAQQLECFASGRHSGHLLRQPIAEPEKTQKNTDCQGSWTTQPSAHYCKYPNNTSNGQMQCTGQAAEQTAPSHSSALKDAILSQRGQSTAVGQQLGASLASLEVSGLPSTAQPDQKTTRRSSDGQTSDTATASVRSTQRKATTA